MNTEQEHMDLWAEKLQEVELPDAGHSWMTMEVVLDWEMPVTGKRDRRRWLLLGILLLLLIGVCNCPRIRGLHMSGAQTPLSDKLPDKINTQQKNGTDLPPEAKGKVGAKARQENDHQKEVSDASLVSQEDKGSLKKAPGQSGPLNSSTMRDSLQYASNRRLMETNSRTEKNNRKGMNNPEKDDASVQKDLLKQKADQKQKNNRKQKDLLKGNDVLKQRDLPEQNDTLRQRDILKQKDTLQKKDLPKQKDTLKQKDLLKQKDTLNQKPPSPQKDTLGKKKPENITRGKGWTAGLGLNQFFTIDGQQRSDFNSDGTSGVLTDYLPVPMIRYHFSRKLYLQAEIQFNTPQYIKNNLLVNQQPDSSSSVPVSRVYLKKLFYFNIPLSLHFSPYKNFYLGAGLQFSRLSNGIILSQTREINSSGIRDSLFTGKTQTLKGDSLYFGIKTNELRLLLDASYQYRKFIFGIRYNLALNNFINIPISATQITQARNSSLQLYLRYILWDSRKKNSAPK